ncbi:MAG TPA: hypothetical protein VGZ73_29615 [Bryobacteraceae bacterium]|nr:hypothetical protein [Bryobacteraceae bacterium]
MLRGVDPYPRGGQGATQVPRLELGVVRRDGQDPGDHRRLASMYGTIDELEPMTISNANGEFELAYKQKAIAMLTWVEARGMAPKLV